jgi:ATP-dependent Clp protease ATP-binding subunit ClpB
MPDKAIDLVDETCAIVRVQLDSQPEEIDNLERKRIQFGIRVACAREREGKSQQSPVCRGQERIR